MLNVCLPAAGGRGTQYSAVDAGWSLSLRQPVRKSDERPTDVPGSAAIGIATLTTLTAVSPTPHVKPPLSASHQTSQRPPVVR
jgi:hypothetical protein